MVADLSNQLEQQFGTLFVIDFRFCTQLFQNDFFRIVSFKINSVALDALPVLHILQILHKQLIPNRHMGELRHIQIKVHKHIFLDPGIRNLNAWNRDEFIHSSPVRFLGLLKHPCGNRHFVLFERLTKVFVLGYLLLDRFYDLLCLRRSNRVSRGMLNMFLDLRLNQLRCFLEQCIRGIRLFNFGMGICLFQFGIRLGINRQLGINDLFQLYFLNFDHISGLEDRIALLRFCQDIVELIMGSQHHSVHIPVAGALTIGQTQASSDHLLSKNLGCCRAKRHNGIEVVDIPTFLEHIDVDYDFYRVFGILHIQKQPGVGFGFCTFLLGMNNDGFVAVCAATELVRLYKLLHPCCMVGIFTDHQHKRLHDRLSMVDSINLQFPFGALMTGDAVQQHHFIQLLVPKVVKINVGACDSKGCTSIAVLDGLGQRILIYNIFERNLLITLRHKGSRS